MSKLHERIKELLAASAPCTLIEILAEVLTQTDIPKQKALPRVIQAIADLTVTGEIKEWEQMPLETAIEYAWELGDDAKAKYVQSLLVGAEAKPPTPITTITRRYVIEGRNDYYAIDKYIGDQCTRCVMAGIKKRVTAEQIQGAIIDALYYFKMDNRIAPYDA